MNTIIAGAYYYDIESDTILIPHYSGGFWMVDCNQYVKIEELKDRYNKDYILSVKDDFITYNREKYYNAEYSPWTVGEWKLLSDISELKHIENDFDF